MTDDYTPSLNTARLAWSGFRVMSDVPFNEGDAEFDRMIAQVRAEALREAADALSRAEETFDRVLSALDPSTGDGAAMDEARAIITEYDKQKEAGQ